MWYPVKLLHISYNLFAGTEMLSLSVYEPIAIQILLGGTVPQFGRGVVELGGLVLYPVKLLHISYNVFVVAEMLSLSVCEPIGIQMLLGGRPQFGRGVELGGLFKLIRYLASFRSHTPCKFCGWGLDPQIGGRGGARRSKWFHSKV